MAKSARQANRRDPDRTRNAILVAAQTEFGANGLSGARVDAIARRARANKRMIYHYFGSKTGLYLAALERVYEDLLGTERTLDLARLPPVAAIRRLVEFTFDYSHAHPEIGRATLVLALRIAVGTRPREVVGSQHCRC